MALEKLETAIRREQIVEAALSLIARRGTRRLSMATLARHVGLVPSALYRHFKNKQDIIAAAVQLIGQKARENLKEVRDLAPNALERLELLLGRFLKMIRELQAMPRIVFSEGMSSEHPEGKLQAFAALSGVLSELETIFLQGQQRGEIRPDIDAKTLAVMFWGMLPPLVILWHISDGQFDVSRHAEKSWQLFSEAIRAR